MKASITRIIIASQLALLSLFGVATLTAQPVAAGSPADQVRQGYTEAGGGSEAALGIQIKNVINVLLFIIGVVSVIMIIVGGIKYVLSNGDSSQITAAKNTILYAVIGLIVALLAYAIVNFVVRQFA